MITIKAQIIGFIIIMALVFLIIGTVSNVSMHASSSSTILTARETKILSSLDQIEAVKAGIKHMVNFSFQQGVYELMKSGCYLNENYYKLLTGKSLSEEEYPFWRNYTDKIFLKYLEISNNNLKCSDIEECLYSDLTSSTFRNVKKYLDELDKKFEIKVDFNKLELYKQQDHYFLVFDGFIYYLHEFFLINDTFRENLNVSYLMLFEILDILIDRFIEGKEIENLIEKSIFSLPSECKEITLDICEQDYDSGKIEEVIKHTCPDFEKLLEGLLKENIENYYLNLFGWEVRLRLDDSKISYKYSVDISDSRENRECECKKIKDRVKTTEKCNGKEVDFCQSLGYVYGECDTQDDTIVCFGCEFYNKLKLKINYDYLVASKILVNTTSNEFYPLYEEKEGKMSLKPITLRFFVITSNDYSWRAV